MNFRILPDSTCFELRSPFSKFYIWRLREISIHKSMLFHRRGVKHLAIMERELTGKTTKDFVLEVVTDLDPLLHRLRDKVDTDDARAVLAQDSLDFIDIARQCSNGIIPHCGDFYELIECLKLNGALGSALSAIKKGLASGPIYMEASSVISVIKSTAFFFEPEIVYPLLRDLLNVAQKAGISEIQVTKRDLGNIAEALLTETWEITPKFYKLHHADQIAKYVNVLTCYYWNLLALLPSNEELLYPEQSPEEPDESADNSLSLSEPEEAADSYDGSSSSDIAILSENEDSNGDPQGRIEEIPGQTIDLMVLSRFITRQIQKHKAETAESSRGTREEGVNGTEHLNFNVNPIVFSPFEPARYIYLIYWVVNKWEYPLIPILFGVGVLSLIWLLKKVHISIPPGFGIISYIVSTFPRKPVFGYPGMVYAMISIGVPGSIVRNWVNYVY